MAKILIVEDSTLISNAIKIILEKNKYDVIQTSEGAKVVDIVKKEKVDLVVLDLNMPEVSGEEVFNMLRNDSETKSVKIMILTAKADALKWNEELKGCDKFMAKPFDNNVLVAEIEKLLA